MRESLLKKKINARVKRKKRIRAKISGCSETPRVTIFKSNRYFYAQAVDDTKSHTIAYSDGKKLGVKANIEGAKVIGENMANSLKASGVESIVFDRNGYQYHGVVKSFVDSLKENGIRV